MRGAQQQLGEVRGKADVEESRLRSRQREDVEIKFSGEIFDFDGFDTGDEYCDIF